MNTETNTFAPSSSTRLRTRITLRSLAVRGRESVGILFLPALLVTSTVIGSACTTSSDEDNAAAFAAQPVPAATSSSGEIPSAKAQVGNDPIATSRTFKPTKIVDAFETPENVVHKASPAPTLLSLEVLAHDEPQHDFVAEGDALLEDGRTGEALLAFRHALFNADSAEVWERLGNTYAKAGEPERSVAALEAALQKKESASVRKSLTRAYLRTHDSQARAHAESLVRQQPTAKNQYLLGRAYAQVAMWHEAIEAFDETLASNPDNIFAHNNLGFAALQVGENHLALAHLEQILDLEPLKPYMLNNLGLAYERQDRSIEALAAYSFASELRPNYIKARVNSQRARQELTDDEQALSAEILVDMREPVAIDGAGMTTAMTVLPGAKTID